MGKPSSLYPSARDTGVLFIPASRFDPAVVDVSAYAAVGDVLDAHFLPPRDLDESSDVEFRVVYSTDQATADAITWLITLGFAEPETTAVLPIVPATALDTVVPADTASTVANSIQMTAAGSITGAGSVAALMKPPLSFTTGGVEQIVLAGIRVEMDAYAGTLPGDTVNFAGVVMSYKRKSI